MKILVNNIIRHNATVTRQRRELQNRHKAVVLWFTGLPSSGKSTIAHTVEEKLHQMGCHTFVFDGDNVRHGLCSDLGFSKMDRTENIRRIGEMSKLFVEAGIIVLAAFVSPFRSDRRKLKELFKDGDFIDIFCSCPVEICAQRDPKGHYDMAKTGKLKDFTGISAPYESSEHSAITLKTAEMTIGECANIVIAYMINNKILTIQNIDE